VLHHAGKITEPYVDELDVLVFEVSQEFLGIGEHTSSWHRIFDTGAAGAAAWLGWCDAMGRELLRRIPIVSVVLRRL
jgi:hypothetical protein